MTPQQLKETGNQLYKESKFTEAIPFLKSAAEALPDEELIWQQLTLACVNKTRHQVRFGGPEDDPSTWTCILEDGWVDPEWIDLQVLRPILEKGAAELGTNFDFDVWAVKGVLGKKPEIRHRK
jgi:hypothetical protein